MKFDPQKKIVDLFNRGNRQAFTAIYDLYHAAILHFAKRFLGDLEEARDITAEAFFKLWERRGYFESLAKIRAFLFTTVRHDCLDYFRHLKIKTEKQKEIQNELLTDEQALWFNTLISADYSNRFHAEIEKLPDRCREIFKLSFFEGLSISAIAERLQITEKTVLNQRKLAVNKLQKIFGNKT